MPNGPDYQLQAAEYAAACNLSEQAAQAFHTAMRKAIQIMPEPPVQYVEAVTLFNEWGLRRKTCATLREAIQARAVW